jgi:hypothetical protein
MSKLTYTGTGHRCGETHHMAKHSDETVRKALELYKPYVFGYDRTAKALGVPRETVRDWVQCSTRGTA